MIFQDSRKKSFIKKGGESQRYNMYRDDFLFFMRRNTDTYHGTQGSQSTHLEHFLLTYWTAYVQWQYLYAYNTCRTSTPVPTYLRTWKSVEGEFQLNYTYLHVLVCSWWTSEFLSETRLLLKIIVMKGFIDPITKITKDCVLTMAHHSALKSRTKPNNLRICSGTKY